jgi:hypothetical protein
MPGALLPCLELLIISDDGVARPVSECPDRLPALALELDDAHVPPQTYAFG